MKVASLRSAFEEFLGYVVIDSKEVGRMVLGDHVYEAQHRFITTVFDALENDIHDIYIGKSRQLGMSSISRALSAFWLGWHEGLRGGVVFDTFEHTSEARNEIASIIRGIPTSFKFPTITDDNRTRLRLSNGSQLLFMSAGTTKNKTGGGLGRSYGLNFSHCSEISSFANEEGLAAYRRSLAQDWPNRLYIWESTARGYNEWHRLWEDAKADDLSKKTVFIGWWAKDNQRIERGTRGFERYGVEPPTDSEKDRIDRVARNYDWQITPEQLAWYRKMSDPGRMLEDGEGEDSLVIQEDPWTEEEMFQSTGSTFFPSETLTKAANRIQMMRANPAKYKFVAGTNFVECNIWSAKTRSADLRVWEEPQPYATYVVAADPAFGRDEANNHSAAQELRCYADCVEQVAEYASPLCPPHHFAWFLLALVGWYGGSAGGTRVLFICELNGPGEEVWRHYNQTITLVQRGYLRRAALEKGISDIATNATKYVYTRSDSMMGGHNWMWKSSQQLKVQAMEGLRNYQMNGGFITNSMELLEEMRTVSRDGDKIGAEGRNRDDRTFAAAMGVRGWDDRLRRRLIAGNRTRQSERASVSATTQDQNLLYNNYQLSQFFQRQDVQRNAMIAQQQRFQWRQQSRMPRRRW